MLVFRLLGGGYLCFVDADDVVADNVLLPIVRASKYHGLDAYYFEITSKLPLDSLSDEDAKKCIISEQRGRQCAPLVLSKKFVEQYNLRYEVGRKFGEDQLFNFFVTVNTNKVGYVDKKIYFYRVEQNDSSVTKSLFTSKAGAIEGSQEYQYYSDSLFNASKFKERQNKGLKHLKVYNETMLSNALMMTMWAGMRGLLPSNKVLNDLKSAGLSPCDITRKTIEGHSFKMRIKSEIQFLFRYPMAYRIISYFFRKLN